MDGMDKRRVRELIDSTNWAKEYDILMKYEASVLQIQAEYQDQQRDALRVKAAKQAVKLEKAKLTAKQTKPMTKSQLNSFARKHEKSNPVLFRDTLKEQLNYRMQDIHKQS